MIRAESRALGSTPTRSCSRPRRARSRRAPRAGVRYLEAVPRRAAPLAAILALPGCVLPFAAPPTEAVFDMGARRPPRAPIEAAVGGSFLARPFAAPERLHDRLVDAGVGLRVERGGRVGPAAEVRAFFVDHADRGGARTRGGVSFEARAFPGGDEGSGMAGAVRVLGERMVPQRGVCGETHDRKALFAGCAAGEWAIGGLVETSYGVLGGVPVHAIGVGLSVRLPAVAAIGLVSK
jgi:hypothetical protein